MNRLSADISDTRVPWLKARVHWSTFSDLLSGKSVPQHRHAFWYFFGGLALFFFIVQVITGFLLLLYYSPTPDTANESVRRIVFQVPFGWWIRSVHSWSAHLMVGSVLVHMASTFFMQAYRRPREVLWISGVLLLFLILGFAFTGYLLPWDTTAYFATQIGTEIPRSAPFLGEIVVRILRGSEFVGEESLRRLFALHVAILPAVSFFLVLVHLVLNQLHGTSIPPGIEPSRPPLRFFPNYLYRDALAWCAGFLVLLWLSLMFPVNIGAKANPYASAPAGIKPEWYFLPLFQTLRWLPATVLGVDTELLVNAGVGLLGFVFLGMPFIDRRGRIDQPNKILRVLGMIFLAYNVVAIIAAYLTT